MQQHNIEPRLLVPRHKHANAVAPQLKVHALILDVADPVQAEMGVALAQQYGAHRDAVTGRVRVGHGEIKLAHVVYETSNREYVQGAQRAFL